MEPLNRVLIVDDEPYVRSFLKNLLEPQFVVQTANDGAQALVLAAERPDVILIDVSMPGLSGVDVCKTLRAARNKAAIIMLTGFDDAETRDACVRAGADDVLSKPFHPDDLVARITRCLDA